MRPFVHFNVLLLRLFQSLPVCHCLQVSVCHLLTLYLSSLALSLVATAAGETVFCSKFDILLLLKGEFIGSRLNIYLTPAFIFTMTDKQKKDHFFNVAFSQGHDKEIKLHIAPLGKIKCFELD